MQTITLDKLQHDLILFFCSIIYVLLVIFIPKILKEKGVISGFSARKIIHSLAGLSIFITPYMYYPVLALTIALSSTIMTRKSGEKSKVKPLHGLYKAISENEELQVGYLQGPFAYSIAITILVFAFIFWPSFYYIPISAILIMMFADTAASIVGKRYGKIHLHIPKIGQKRTLEGSITFFLVALICSFPTFLFFGQIYPGFSYLLSLNQILILTFSISTLSTGLELISPSKYDDLIIPLGATLITSGIMVLIM